MRIRDLNISARARVCLMGAGYNLLEELKGVSNEDLLNIKNINADCIREILNAIIEYCSDEDEHEKDYEDNVFYDDEVGDYDDEYVDENEDEEDYEKNDEEYENGDEVGYEDNEEENEDSACADESDDEIVFEDYDYYYDNDLPELPNKIDISRRVSLEYYYSAKGCCLGCKGNEKKTFDEDLIPETYNTFYLDKIDENDYKTLWKELKEIEKKYCGGIDYENRDKITDWESELCYEQGKFIQNINWIGKDIDDISEMDIYWCTYNKMTYDQLKYYIYWRTNFRKGVIVGGCLPIYYLFANELVAELGPYTPKERLNQMEKLIWCFDSKDSLFLDLVKQYVVYHDLEISDERIIKEFYDGKRWQQKKKKWINAKTKSKKLYKEYEEILNGNYKHAYDFLCTKYSRNNRAKILKELNTHDIISSLVEQILPEIKKQFENKNISFNDYLVGRLCEQEWLSVPRYKRSIWNEAIICRIIIGNENRRYCYRDYRNHEVYFTDKAGNIKRKEFRQKYYYDSYLANYILKYIEMVYLKKIGCNNGYFPEKLMNTMQIKEGLFSKTVRYYISVDINEKNKEKNYISLYNDIECIILDISRKWFDSHNDEIGILKGNNNSAQINSYQGSKSEIGNKVVGNLRSENGQTEVLYVNFEGFDINEWYGKYCGRKEIHQSFSKINVGRFSDIYTDILDRFNRISKEYPTEFKPDYNFTTTSVLYQVEGLTGKDLNTLSSLQNDYEARLEFYQWLSWVEHGKIVIPMNMPYIQMLFHFAMNRLIFNQEPEKCLVVLCEIWNYFYDSENKIDASSDLLLEWIKDYWLVYCLDITYADFKKLFRYNVIFDNETNIIQARSQDFIDISGMDPNGLLEFYDKTCRYHVLDGMLVQKGYKKLFEEAIEQVHYELRLLWEKYGLVFEDSLCRDTVTVREKQRNIFYRGILKSETKDYLKTVFESRNVSKDEVYRIGYDKGKNWPVIKYEQYEVSNIAGKTLLEYIIKNTEKAISYHLGLKYVYKSDDVKIYGLFDHQLFKDNIERHIIVKCIEEATEKVCSIYGI